MTERKKGAVGWICVGGFVVVWDRYVDDALTHAFRRAAKCPYRRPIVIAGWTVLTAHLFDVLPQRYDPIHILYHRIHKASN